MSEARRAALPARAAQLGFPGAPKALYPKLLHPHPRRRLQDTRRPASSPTCPIQSNPGQVMERGLWRNFRHPSYFGGFFVWWGFDRVALSAQGW
ncbi:MAG: DUF1295 domain-containing protein [Rhodoferax sp.]|nr:DUF1295 domain-containing protein [Rhodoferax sp.]